MLEEAKCLWEGDIEEEKEEEMEEREVPRELAGVSMELIRKIRNKERKIKVKKFTLKYL